MKYREIQEHDKVRLKKTGELGFIVWIHDEFPEKDSVMIEMMGNEGPVHFYKSEDFELVEE